VIPGNIIIHEEIVPDLRLFGSIKKFVGKVGSLIGGYEKIFRNPQSVNKNI
jgi:hypothetical protein